MYLYNTFLKLYLNEKTKFWGKKEEKKEKKKNFFKFLNDKMKTVSFLPSYDALKRREKRTDEFYDEVIEYLFDLDIGSKKINILILSTGFGQHARCFHNTLSDFTKIYRYTSNPPVLEYNGLETIEDFAYGEWFPIRRCKKVETCIKLIDCYDTIFPDQQKKCNFVEGNISISSFRVNTLTRAMGQGFDEVLYLFPTRSSVYMEYLSYLSLSSSFIYSRAAYQISPTYSFKIKIVPNINEDEDKNLLKYALRNKHWEHHSEWVLNDIRKHMGNIISKELNVCLEIPYPVY